LNPLKHKYDRYVYCPFCRAEIENTYYQRGIVQHALWWVRRKLEERRKKKRAEEILQKYFAIPVMDASGRIVDWKYQFPLRKYLQGHRPAVHIEDVIEALGGNPTEEMIVREVERLEKEGIKVIERSTTPPYWKGLAGES